MYVLYMYCNGYCMVVGWPITPPNLSYTRFTLPSNQRVWRFLAPCLTLVMTVKHIILDSSQPIGSIITKLINDYPKD